MGNVCGRCGGACACNSAVACTSTVAHCARGDCAAHCCRDMAFAVDRSADRVCGNYGRRSRAPYPGRPRGLWRVDPHCDFCRGHGSVGDSILAMRSRTAIHTVPRPSVLVACDCGCACECYWICPQRPRQCIRRHERLSDYRVPLATGERRVGPNAQAPAAAGVVWQCCVDCGVDTRVGILVHASSGQGTAPGLCVRARLTACRSDVTDGPIVVCVTVVVDVTVVLPRVRTLALLYHGRRVCADCCAVRAVARTTHAVACALATDTVCRDVCGEPFAKLSHWCVYRIRRDVRHCRHGITWSLAARFAPKRGHSELHGFGRGRVLGGHCVPASVAP